jgi:hypothetical protein
LRLAGSAHVRIFCFLQLLDKELWIVEKFKAPVFTGGPYVIWGLTGYILHRFVQDVLVKLVTID